MASAIPIAFRALPRISRGLTRATPIPYPVFNPLLNQRNFGWATAKSQIIKRFTEDHEWISVDPETRIGTIGITDYAQDALGDVVHTELPTIYEQVVKGDPIGAVESVKSASDLMSPVSGIISEVNTALRKKPRLINKGAEGEDGWIVRLQISEIGMRELDGMMDETAYQAHTADE
ncbi:glycine cleavage system H-protein subunit [Arthrobotrys megalospora]